MPDCDNLGLCCSFHGSCSNLWFRAGKEARTSVNTAQQQQVMCHKTASQKDWEWAISTAWLQLTEKHPWVQFPFSLEKWKWGTSHDPSWCSYPSWHQSKLIQTPFLLLFPSAVLLPQATSGIVTQVAEGTVGQWPGHQPRAASCLGLTQHS